MKLLIPTKMRVGRYKYTVKIVEKARMKGAIGCVDYTRKEIEVATKSPRGKDLPAVEAYDTFWHETTHAILHDMGYEHLARNEKFVSAFSRRLTGVMLSAEFAE